LALWAKNKGSRRDQWWLPLLSGGHITSSQPNPPSLLVMCPGILPLIITRRRGVACACVPCCYLMTKQPFIHLALLAYLGRHSLLEPSFIKRQASSSSSDSSATSCFGRPGGGGKGPGQRRKAAAGTMDRRGSSSRRDRHSSRMRRRVDMLHTRRRGERRGGYV
jgi:hypothetical protein